MRMLPVVIILTLSFIKGHTDLNHENNKCLIILQTVQAMPMKFDIKIVRLKIFIIVASSVNLTFAQGHSCLKLYQFLTCSLLVIYRTIFKL